MQPLPLFVSRAYPSPMIQPESLHAGHTEYVARVHNLWLLRQHLPLPEGVADLYQALLFLWLQQGYPARIAASLPDLVELTGAAQRSIQDRLKHLLQEGLLANKEDGYRGSPTLWELGPEPATLLAARFPKELNIRWQILPPNANRLQNLPPNEVNNRWQNLPPIINEVQNLPPNATAKILQLPKPEDAADRVQNLPPKAPVVVVDKGTEKFISLNKSDEKTPSPLPPAPAKMTAAQEYEQRKQQNQAAAVAFEQYLAAYEGKNTETVQAWKLWVKLSPQDWTDILAFLPAYCLYTSGSRLQFRQGNAKFISAETWRSADKLQMLKEQYTKTINPHSHNGTAQNTNVRPAYKRITNTQRQNSPDVSDYGSLSDDED